MRRCKLLTGTIVDELPGRHPVIGVDTGIAGHQGR